MARFDIYKSAGRVDYFLDIQADVHDRLGTRLVIPVIAASKATSMHRLMVTLTIDDLPHYAIVPMMAAVPSGQLGRHVGNAAEHSHEIIAAIDLLLQGF